MISAQKYAQSLDLTFEDFVDQKMGLTVEEFNKQAIDYAKVAAKESMVLQAIARAENITVSDEDIEKAITAIDTARARLRSNVNFDLTMEMLMLELRG